MDHIWLSPGSYPARESLSDVRQIGFLNQLKRPCAVYGGGAKVGNLSAKDIAFASAMSPTTRRSSLAEPKREK